MRATTGPSWMCSRPSSAATTSSKEGDTPEDLQVVCNVLARRSGVEVRLRADDSPVDLSHTDLSGVLLSGCHFEGAYLANARLVGVDFYGAHLQWADLWGADFKDANLGS